jgi:hypothetical protein
MSWYSTHIFITWVILPHRMIPYIHSAVVYVSSDNEGKLELMVGRERDVCEEIEELPGFYMQESAFVSVVERGEYDQDGNFWEYPSDDLAELAKKFENDISEVVSSITLNGDSTYDALRKAEAELSKSYGADNVRLLRI